ncbi:MAG TPA: prepilin-type N-terminal cleavage/methylation domain-containing protein [Patescibacteria group bacterium]
MKKGFTLIELLVVITIIGILLAISIFGLIGARESSRDVKRKAELEQIRSGIEVYKSDCNVYPASLGASLVGSGSPSTCAATNVYIATTPVDPLSPARAYSYYSNGSTYEVCASLESGTGSVTCGGSSTCGSSTCNYKVTNP